MKLDTKDRIIEVATKLFADRGFEGTSVREIAKFAEVNLAAVNYHFSNKQNLYHHVLRHGVNEFRNQIQALAEEKERTTVEFAISMYRMLTANASRLINNFKVLLNDLPVPEDIMEDDKMMGPPGAEYLWLCLEKEITSKNISEADKIWATRVIFTNVVHTALMASTHFGKQHCFELFSSEIVEATIERLVVSIIRELNYR